MKGNKILNIVLYMFLPVGWMVMDNKKPHMGLIAGQCELPVMEDGNENDDGTENKIYKVLQLVKMNCRSSKIDH